MNKIINICHLRYSKIFLRGDHSVNTDEALILYMYVHILLSLHTADCKLTLDSSLQKAGLLVAILSFLLVACTSLVRSMLLN